MFGKEVYNYKLINLKRYFCHRGVLESFKQVIRSLLYSEKKKNM